jgi:hypothetical protein
MEMKERGRKLVQGRLSWSAGSSRFDQIWNIAAAACTLHQARLENCHNTAQHPARTRQLRDSSRLGLFQRAAIHCLGSPSVRGGLLANYLMPV